MPGFGDRYVGAVKERSRRHVAGWVVDLTDSDRKIPLSIGVQNESGFLELTRLSAQDFRNTSHSDPNDVETFYHGFSYVLPDARSLEEGERLSVRLPEAGLVLPDAGTVQESWQPIALVAMDITNNCNLRCPFCVTNYAGVNRTYLMPEDTFARVAELLSYVRDGGFFWLSCIHEATLHPRILDLIDSVPPPLRRHIAFTTNLAKPLKDTYLEALVNSGIRRVNLSIDSMTDPAFGKLRKGGRVRIFLDNLKRLSGALSRSPNPVDIHVYSMAFKSNLEELPGLIRWAFASLGSTRHFVRHPLLVPHIPEDFLQAEELDHSDWDWLENELRDLSGKITFERKLQPDAKPSKKGNLPAVPLEKQKSPVHPLTLAVKWNGDMEVRGLPLPGKQNRVPLHRFNVHKVEGPLIDYLMQL